MKREKAICCIVFRFNVLNVVVLHFTFHFSLFTNSSVFKPGRFIPMTDLKAKPLRLTETVAGSG